MAQTATVSTSGASATIILNPIYKETVMQVTVNSGSSGLTAVQFTLDDPSIVPPPSVVWASLSSAIASSAADGTGATFALLSPLNGVRLFATTASTTGGLFGTTATLKVLQSVTG